MSLLVRNKKHAFLRSRAFYFVVLDDEFLFQDFNGIELFRALCFSQHDLSEVTLSKHSEEIEVIQADPPASALGVCRGCNLVFGRLG